MTTTSKKEPMHALWAADRPDVRGWKYAAVHAGDLEEYGRLCLGLEAACYRVDLTGPNAAGEYLVTTIDPGGRVGPMAIGDTPVDAVRGVRAQVADSTRSR